MSLTRHTPTFSTCGITLLAAPSRVCSVVARDGTSAGPDGGAAVGVFTWGACGIGTGEVVTGDPADFGVGDAEATRHSELGGLCEMGVAEGEDGCEDGGGEHGRGLDRDIGDGGMRMWLM